MNKSEVVTSKAYRLIAPGKFVETTLQHEVKQGQVVVKPTLASICHADLRYYTGRRKKNVLKEKLPMALFHEGIGHVVISNADSVPPGQRVVIVPNIPGRLLNNNSGKGRPPQSTLRKNVADNYAADSVFLGSGYDGIGQSHLVLPAENAVPVPASIPDRIAVLTELSSVSLHAIHHVSAFLKEGKVAVFGDGPVGFLTAAMLYHVFRIPKSQLLVFGAVREKLAQFDFATTYLVHDYHFHRQQNVATVIECTGGVFSESAINQAIDLIAPQGKIVLLGVSEERVPINTRDVLAKGLTLIGSSRSTVRDFKALMQNFQNQAYQQTLEKLLPDQYDYIRNVNDLHNTMDKASKNKGLKKIIINFDW